MNDKLRRVILIILLLILAFSLYKVGDYFYHSYKSQHEIKELSKDQETKAEKYFRLKKQNSDFIAWIKIPDTPVDYPVMWSPDVPEKYLYRDFKKEYSGWGLPFADAATPVGESMEDKDSVNTVIYAHHMKDGTMFHCLTDYEDQKYYEKHKIIKYDRVYKSGYSQSSKFLIIGAFKTEIGSEGEFKYYNYAAMTKEDISEYLSKLEEKNLIKVKGKHQFTDRFLTLSTCSFHVSGDNGRFVVIARELK